MHKRDALKLKIGSHIRYGNSAKTVEVRTWHIGRVQHVTSGGGVRVRHNDGSEAWVPYHHILGVAKDVDAAGNWIA